MPAAAVTDDDLVRIYLSEIGRHALLTKADEARLGAQVKAGLAAVDELAEGRPHACPQAASSPSSFASASTRRTRS